MFHASQPAAQHLLLIAALGKTQKALRQILDEQLSNCSLVAQALLPSVFVTELRNAWACLMPALTLGAHFVLVYLTNVHYMPFFVGLAACLNRTGLGCFSFNVLKRRHVLDDDDDDLLMSSSLAFLAYRT